MSHMRLLPALLLVSACHAPPDPTRPTSAPVPSSEPKRTEVPPPADLEEAASRFGVVMEGGWRWRELDRDATRFDWSGRSPAGHEARWSFWLKGEELEQARPFLPQVVASAAANLTKGRPCEPFDQPAEIATMLGADRVVTVCFEPAEFVTKEFRLGVLHGLLRGDVLVIVIVLANDRTGTIPSPDSIGGRFRHPIPTAVEIDMRPGSAEITIELPQAATTQALPSPYFPVIVGLDLHGPGGWSAGHLLESDEARRSLATPAKGAFGGDAVLLRLASGMPVVDAPPLSSGERRLRYRVVTETTYEHGRHWLSLDWLDGASNMRVRAARGRLMVGAGGPFHFVPITTVGQSGVAHWRRDLAIALESPHAGPIDGALTGLPLGDGRAVTSFRVEAAPRFSELPQGAHVVIVLDTSRSMEDGKLRAAASMAHAALRHLPDARAAIVTFDRQARVLSRFEPSEHALVQLESLRVPLRNGSHVERAIEVALSLLTAAPEGAPRRVLVFSDARTRTALDVARAVGTAVAKQHALVHLVRPRPGPILASDGREVATLVPASSEDRWTSVLAKTGGLAWDASAGEESEERLGVFEELVRPTQLRDVTVSGSGFQDALDHLAEDQGWEQIVVTSKPPPTLRVRGRLWAKTVQRKLVWDAGESSRVAALALGRVPLGAADYRRLARYAKAVTAETSYFVTVPGARGAGQSVVERRVEDEPPPEAGHRAFPPRVTLGSWPDVEQRTILASRLALARRACTKSAVRARVETTSEEIVDVVVETSDARAARCIEEQIWSLELPESRRRDSHDHWTFDDPP